MESLKIYNEKKLKEKTCTFVRPTIDLQATGNRIKSLRTKSGFSIKNIQDVFGFQYPQAVYSWEQGKNIPTIDNLLILAKLFDVSIEEIVVIRNVEVEIQASGALLESICKKNCENCSAKLAG